MLSDFNIKDEGKITVTFLDKKFDGSFNTEYDFQTDIETAAQIKKEFSIKEKEKAFKYFIDNVVALT